MLYIRIIHLVAIDWLLVRAPSSFHSIVYALQKQVLLVMETRLSKSLVRKFIKHQKTRDDNHPEQKIVLSLNNRRNDDPVSIPMFWVIRTRARDELKTNRLRRSKNRCERDVFDPVPFD